MSGELIATFKEHESTTYNTVASGAGGTRVFSNLHRVSDDKFYVWGSELNFGSYKTNKDFFYCFYKFTGGPGNDYWRGIKKDHGTMLELNPDRVRWFCQRAPLAAGALEDWLGDKLLYKMFPAYDMLGLVAGNFNYMHYIVGDAQPAFRRDSVFDFEAELCGSVVATLLDGAVADRVPHYIHKRTPFLSALIRMPKGHKRDYDPVLALTESSERVVQAVSGLLDFANEHGGVAAKRAALDEFFESDTEVPPRRKFGGIQQYDIAQMVPRFFKTVRLTPEYMDGFDDYLHYTRTREPIVCQGEQVRSLSELANVMVRSNVHFEWSGLAALYEFGLDNQRAGKVH